MDTCEICDAPLGTSASNEPVRQGLTTYHVCSYTCETVLRDRSTPNARAKRPQP